MKISGLTLLLICSLFFFGTAMPCLNAAKAAAGGSAYYRARQLGDIAFDNHAYREAVNYYTKYLKQAKDDPATLKDAYECLITALIRASEPDKAEKLLDEYVKEFPGTDRIKVLLFRADIKILRFRYNEAADIFRDVIAELPSDSPLYFNTLSNLGFVLGKLEDWRQAAEIYSHLQEAGRGGNWEFIAYERKIYAMIMAGDFKEAAEELKKPPKPDKYIKSPDYYALNILLPAREGKLEDAFDRYTEFRDKLGSEPNTLVYMTDMLMAEKYAEKKDLKKAIDFLREAFLFANSRFDRQKTLRMIINMYVEAGSTSHAAAAAKRYCEYYKDAEDYYLIRLQLARLLAEDKKNREALSIYEQMRSSPDVETELKIEAAKEAAGILINLNDFSAAEKELKFIYNQAPGESLKEEARYLIAKLLYIQKKYPEAAKAFMEVAALSSGEWKEKCLFWAMYSYFETGEFKKALAVSETIFREFPEGKTLRENQYFHGLILEKSGSRENSRKELLAFAEKYPDHQYAPEAMFRAGTDAYEAADFEKAAEIFSGFIVRFPQSPLAPGALYKKILSDYALKKDDDAVKDVELLAEKYSNSDYALSALFWLVDFYREKKEFGKAGEILERIIKKYGKKDPNTAAQALYDAACICTKAGDPEKALSCLKKLKEKYPDSRIVSEALFLEGDVYSEKGDYEKAILYYKKAAERRPASPLELASVGRIGDCNFSLYTKSFDTKKLEAALAEYRKILEHKNLPPLMKNQSVYKIGKCCELMGQEDKALEKFNELIYGYTIDGANRFKPIWTVKAAHAAIGIYLKKNTPYDAWQAVRIYRQLIRMGIPMSEDYKQLVKQIREKYKI